MHKEELAVQSCSQTPLSWLGFRQTGHLADHWGGWSDVQGWGQVLRALLGNVWYGEQNLGPWWAVEILRTGGLICY